MLDFYVVIDVISYTSPRHQAMLCTQNAFTLRYQMAPLIVRVPHNMDCDLWTIND